jgi:hypothetical protein
MNRLEELAQNRREPGHEAVDLDALRKADQIAYHARGAAHYLGEGAALKSEKTSVPIEDETTEP